MDIFPMTIFDMDIITYIVTITVVVVLGVCRPCYITRGYSKRTWLSRSPDLTPHVIASFGDNMLKI